MGYANAAGRLSPSCRVFQTQVVSCLHRGFQYSEYSQAFQRLARRDPGVRGVIRSDQRLHCPGRYVTAHPDGSLAPVRVVLVLPQRFQHLGLPAFHSLVRPLKRSRRLWPARDLFLQPLQLLQGFPQAAHGFEKLLRLLGTRRASR